MAVLLSEHPAAGGPGIEPRWTRSDKDGVGTAYSVSSRVWFTVSKGILNEVYYPTIDRPQVRDLQYLITDGETFFCDERHLDNTHACLAPDILGYRVASTDSKHRYRILLHLGRTVRTLDPPRKRVTDDQGAVYTYDKLLLATGGTPRRLPFGGDRIIYFRTLDDYQRVRALTEQGQQFAVIGGGVIGAEVAAALAMNGKQVVMTFPEAGIGSRMFPRDLAAFLDDYYRQKGVEVRAGEQVVGLEVRDRWVVLTLRGAGTAAEHRLEADGVVAGIGIEPNVDLARSAGLKVENGIVVDASLRTSHPDIFAAGDVASFANPSLGMRLRVEHEDNANTMGRLAGEATAGQAASYDHLPFFCSDLFELGYEAVGEVDSRLETVADWKEPYREGVVYYVRDGRVRGVLLWNVWWAAPRFLVHLK
jgi:3-phenylpropionate/trans-cinnamate dioxygenase ferredoxin reductase subunit